MDTEKYLDLKKAVIDAGFAEEVDWAEGLTDCPNAESFFKEFAWVVINSGMKAQIAEIIWKRVQQALAYYAGARAGFGHPGKAAAIDEVNAGQYRLFKEYKALKSDEERLAWLQTLPWIGPITKFHLAKNLGMDVMKPDRHLVRIAKSYNMDAGDMCRGLADETGDRITTVDTVIWRAANLGMV